MSELLSTRQLQELLNVDRTTIYRMINSGQLPAIRVGNQWRFPRDAVEAWLNSRVVVSGSDVAPRLGRETTGMAADLAQVIPRECVQQILDAFAEALGVMILLTDLEGNLITEPSNPCGLYSAVDTHPEAHQRCVALWAQMARNPTLRPRFMSSHIGLLCARGLVRVDRELKAMLIVGGIAPPDWPPDEVTIRQMAAELGVPVQVFMDHLDEVYHLSPEEQERILPFVQRIADVVSFIADERKALITRLEQIRRLAELP